MASLLKSACEGLPSKPVQADEFSLREFGLGMSPRIGGGDNRMRRLRTPGMELYPRPARFPIDFQGFLTRIGAAMIARPRVSQDNEKEEAT